MAASGSEGPPGGPGGSPATISACFVCFAPAHLKCSRCRAAWYCGAPCQKADWPKHKGLCGRAKARTLTGAELLAEDRPAAGAAHFITKGAVRGLLEDRRRLGAKCDEVDLAALNSAPYWLGAAEWHDYWVRALRPPRLKKLSDMCRAWLEADGEKLPDL